MWRYGVPVVLLVTLGVFFARGLWLNPGYIPSPLIGKQAPAFKLPSLMDPGKTVSSEDMKGHVSLLNVWGTWCVECRREHAFLVELARTSGIPIYGLNLRDQRADALDWLSTLGDPYTETGFDPNGDAALDWGVYGAPETFLIGRDGTVLYKHISILTPEVWRQNFLPLIRKECSSLPCPIGGAEAAR
jgi:cytochrome c biogenesis protein CcmG/thiol:disulfide interchange protein DsbE